MARIIDRTGKGSALTAAEYDSALDILHGINEAQTGLTHTIDVNDQGKTIEYSNASAIAVTLPAISTVSGSNIDTSDFSVTLKNIGAGVVTMTCGGVDTFENTNTTYTLAQYQCVTIQTDSTLGIWNIISVVDLVVPATANNLTMVDANGRLLDSLIETSGDGANITTNLKGDVLAANGTLVLDSGTDGTDSTYTGDVTGDLTGTASAVANNIVGSNKIITTFTNVTNGAAITAGSAVAVTTTGLLLVRATSDADTVVAIDILVNSVWGQATLVGANQSAAIMVLSNGSNVRVREENGNAGAVYHVDKLDNT